MKVLYVIYAMVGISILYASDYSYMNHVYALQDFRNDSAPSNREYELFRKLLVQSLSDEEVTTIGFPDQDYSTLSLKERQFIFPIMENFRVGATAPHGFSLYNDLLFLIGKSPGLTVRDVDEMPTFAKTHMRHFGSDLVWNDFDHALTAQFNKKFGLDEEKQGQKLRSVIRQIASLCRGNQCPTRQDNYLYRTVGLLLVLSLVRAYIVRSQQDTKLSTLDFLNAWVWRRIPFIKRLFLRGKARKHLDPAKKMAQKTGP